MLAGGADEEVGVDLGVFSAARDILSGWIRWIGRYWRMNERGVARGRVDRRRVDWRSKRRDETV
jgi:hypothetical protein